MDELQRTGQCYTLFQTSGGVMPSFPRIDAISISDTSNTPFYYNDAKTRVDDPHLIFQLTLAGKGLFRRGRKSWALTPGKAFLCESHDPLASYSYPRDEKEVWRFFFMTFTGETATQMVRDIVNESGSVFDFPVDHPLLRKYVSYLNGEFDSVSLPLSESWHLVTELLYELLRIAGRQDGQESDNALIRRAHDLVLEAGNEPINASELAARLHVSREHLTRVFSKGTGESPYRFILRIRLFRACNLLKNTDLPVKEIARLMGFNSVSEFCRPFKRVIRLSPTEFRARGTLPSLGESSVEWRSSAK